MKQISILSALIILVGAFTMAAAQEADVKVTGKSLYEANCGTCHQIDGSGVMFLQPELIGSERANGPKGGVIDMILFGSAAVEPGTSDYGNEMPGFDFLTDEEIALIASYVRTNFENDGGSVSPADVQPRRK